MDQPTPDDLLAIECIKNMKQWFDSRPAVDVKAELEPIVNLRCLAIRCKHNMFNRIVDRAAYCNLKRIEISASGQCSSYEPKEEK